MQTLHSIQLDWDSLKQRKCTDLYVEEGTQGKAKAKEIIRAIDGTVRCEREEATLRRPEDGGVGCVVTLPRARQRAPEVTSWQVPMEALTPY